MHGSLLNVLHLVDVQKSLGRLHEDNLDGHQPKMLQSQSAMANLTEEEGDGENHLSGWSHFKIL